MKNDTQDRSDALSAFLDASHENKWVALAPDYSRVLAVAATLRELMRTATDPSAIFHRVLPHDVSFTPLLA